MQNAAARVLIRTVIRVHITPVLASLHWRPVKYRKELKILLFTYKTLNDQAPSYLIKLIVPCHLTRTLRSLNADLLVILKIYENRIGARAFSYQAPLLSNNLPVSVLEADTIGRQTPSPYLRVDSIIPF